MPKKDVTHRNTKSGRISFDSNDLSGSKKLNLRVNINEGMPDNKIISDTYRRISFDGNQA